MSDPTPPAGSNPGWGPPPSQKAPKPPRPLYKKKRFIIPAGFVAVLIVAGIAGGGSKSNDTSTTVAGTSSAPSLSPTPDPSLSALRAQAEASKAAASASAAAVEAAQSAAAAQASASAEAAKGTLSQQNAYKSAISYLSFKGFSRKGLLQQLTSSAGDGFPAADAEFAVARLEREGGVDWNEQAAKSAKSYLSFKAFSRAGLLQQLTSSAGDGFTAAQAAFGVKAAGL